jgi:hypothetical protein
LRALSPKNTLLKALSLPPPPPPLLRPQRPRLRSWPWLRG